MTGTSAVPELGDGVVTLRAARPDDVDDVVAMGTDPECTRWTTMPAPYERHHAEGWISEMSPAGWHDDTAWAWAIDVGGRFPGNLAVRSGPPPDVGYAVAPWARGRGLALRAVRLATRWAFDHRDLPVIHWTCLTGNLASWRVAHACGFTFHGERPLAVEHRGVLRDVWSASLRPGDPQAPRTTWWPTPVLSSDRVRLRPVSEADVPRIVETNRDPRRRHWIVGLPEPFTDADARAWIRRGEIEASLGHRLGWAVTDPVDDRMLGNVSIFRLGAADNPTGGEIGYGAHPEARGRGVTTEAVRLVVEHAFTPVLDGGLGRHRLQIAASWGNTASRHVAEQNGFTLVGHSRADSLLADGSLDDSAWYERLRSPGIAAG